MNEFSCVYHEVNKTNGMPLEEIGCLFKNSLEKYVPLLKINSKQEVDYKVLFIFKTVRKQ